MNNTRESRYTYNLKTGNCGPLRAGEMEFPNSDIRIVSEGMYIAVNSGSVTRSDLNTFFALASMQGNPNANPDILLEKTDVEVADVKTAESLPLPEPQMASIAEDPVGEQVTSELDAVPEPPSFSQILDTFGIQGANALNTLTNPQLQELSMKIGADISKALRKADMVAAIVAHIDGFKSK